MTSLLEKIRGGQKLSDGDREAIVSALRNRSEQTDVKDLIRALAASSPPKRRYVEIAEEILRTKEDDWSVQGAIYALGAEWGLIEPYVPDFLSLAEIENWRQFSNSAITALSILGEHLHATQDKSVYRSLLRLIDHDRQLQEACSDDFWPVHLECLVRALDEGIRGSEAVFDPLNLKSFYDIPEDLLAAARERAAYH